MPMLGGKTSGFKVPELQTPTRTSKAITQNQWYDAWDGSTVAAGAGSKQKNVEVYGLSFEQAIANEDLEIRIIADNIDQTLSQTAVAATNYQIAKYCSPDNALFFAITTTEFEPYRGILFKCRNLQIMYRKTSAAGANNTSIRVDWGKW